ncbi:imidazolonepropionase [Phycisphaerae bacterium RAS1]|nr:imidazolonepropionase [Phycisphaerae bacterium RAS1]
MSHLASSAARPKRLGARIARGGRSCALPAMLLAALVLGGSGETAAADKAIVVRAARLVTPDGELQDGGLVVIRDGKIAQVGETAPADAVIHEYDDAAICPGLIDVAAALGAFGNLSENQSALQPAAAARDALDRFAPQLDAALRSGVTAFALSPDDQNLVGGRIAICRSGGAGVGGLIAPDGPMKLSLSPDVFKSDREPTSRTGALLMLRSAIESARSGKAAAGDALAQLAAGKIPAIVSAPSGADALAASEMVEDYGLKLTIMHTRDALDVAGEVARRKVGVIVGPLTWNSSRRETAAAAAYEKAGVPVAIAGGAPLFSADSVRLGAALAARGGLSAAAARRAITSNAAAVLGMSERLGAVKPGLEADIVLFSGDPIDLRSRVLAVYVGGRRVYLAPADADEQ